jgi:hypothetical protein
MNTDALIKQFAFQRWYLGLLIDDIPDDQMTRQPPGAVNHPAWQLGHIASVADNAVAIAGGQSILGDDWSKKFAQRSTPLPDPAHYPRKADLIKLVDERRTALVETCAKLTDDDWQKPHQVGSGVLKQSLPTVWHVMHFLMLTHESTHLGQLAAWRRAQGLPMALDRAAARG